jgi:hypothetical protein
MRSLLVAAFLVLNAASSSALAESGIGDNGDRSFNVEAPTQLALAYQPAGSNGSSGSRAKKVAESGIGDNGDRAKKVAESGIGDSGDRAKKFAESGIGE